MRPAPNHSPGPRHGAHLPTHPGNRWVRLGLFVLLAAALASALWFQTHAEALLLWTKAAAASCTGLVAEHTALAWLCYLLLGALIINCPIPAAAVLKLLAGYLFGVSAAWSLNVLISVLGCSLGFVVTRHLFYRAFYARFSHTLAKANLEISRNGFWYVLSCRFFCVMPFFLTNILAGLSSMRLRTFVLGTTLGVIPSSLIYALTGSELERIRSTADFMNPRTAAVLAFLALAALVPAAINRRQRKKA